MKLTNRDLDVLDCLTWCDIISSDELKKIILNHINLSQEELSEVENYFYQVNDEDDILFEIFLEGIDTETNEAEYSIRMYLDANVSKINLNNFMLSIPLILKECA